MLNLTWLYQSLPNLLRNLLRNSVEPDLALHQSLADLRNLPRNPVDLTCMALRYTWNVASARSDGTLLAVRFADNRAPGTTWEIDSEYSRRSSFSTIIIERCSNNLIEPGVMLSFISIGAVRVVLEVITPSEQGIAAERWRKDATVCPPNWPTDYSLLRGWYLQGSVSQFALSQYKKIGHRHMFSEWTLDLTGLASRVFFPRPAGVALTGSHQPPMGELWFPEPYSQRIRGCMVATLPRLRRRWIWTAWTFW